MENGYVYMMEIWSSIAADIIQLAVASLLLPIIFLRKIVGIPDGESLAPHLNAWLYCSWVALVFCIAFGVYYRAANTCLIGKELTGKGGFTCVAYPHLLFGIFGGFFIIGICSFAIGAIKINLTRTNE